MTANINLNKMRDCTIDNIKGFGMILVIVGHMSIYKELNQWIYSFHMPLFTFISALYIKGYSKKELTKKINRLLLPFISFSLLSWLCYTLLTYIYYPQYFSDQLRKILYIFALSGQNACKIWNNGNITLWFLPFLFCSTIAYWIMNHLKIKYIDLAISILLAYICAHYKITLPANLDTVFLLYPFIKIASFYNLLNINNYLITLSLPYKILILFFVFTLHYILSLFNGNVDTSSNIFGNNIIIFYLTAILGILGTILFFYTFNYKFCCINYIGRHSIFYLIFNIPFLQVFDHICNNNEPIYNIIRLLLVLFFTIPLIFVFTKYFPFMLGVKNK